MDFFLLIDKPSGITSFDVVYKVKKAFGIKKVGHSGILDKLATGLLVVAVGKQATKLLEFLIHLDKTYEVEMILGMKSDTYDLSGNLEVFDGKVDFGDEEILTILKSFEGEIMQKPPQYSALKINGKRASDRVRQGEDVDLKARKVTVYRIENFDRIKETRLNDSSGQGKRFRFNVHCSSGTYVRSLVHDLGAKLGCGAVMSNLRRVKVGGFDIKDSLKIEDLNKMDNATNHMQISINDIVNKLFCRINLNKIEFEKVKCGKIIVDHFEKEEENLAAFYDDQFVSILKKEGEILKVYKNF